MSTDSNLNSNSFSASYLTNFFSSDEQSLEGPNIENEDFDSQSHQTRCSSAECMHKPIVVGYAFGPKKMSTMGLVLAEASQVKVIHEELEEDNFDEDEEHDDDGLFCEQEDPSSLTSAALRGLEEDSTGRKRSGGNVPKSTIITIGNSNNTNLKHIVRYFRSSCSSAAASASIASVGETTVSTPTTTNSCPTYNSYKQRRNSRGELNRFPVQISFVPLDPDQPLEEQHGGKFDLILHKLTEDILSCSLMQDANYSNEKNGPNLQQENEHPRMIDPSFRRVRALRDYCYNRNPNCCLVDDPKNVQTVMSRSEIAYVLQKSLKGVKTLSGIPVKSPRFVVIPECSQLNQTLDLVHALQNNGKKGGSKFSTPLIVKPLIAAGTKQSHYMLIALRESALTKLPPKSIVQEYVNHDATLYKVYVLGDFVNVYRRKSLPNLPSDFSEAAVDLVEFDSQRPYPNLKDFGFDMKDDSDCVQCDISEVTHEITEDEVKPIVEVLKEAFGLELFGFDIVMDSNRRECLVVDVNYFPSYKEVLNFPSLLARYLIQRVSEQRRKGRMFGHESNNNNVFGAESSFTIATSAQKREVNDITSDKNIDISPPFMNTEAYKRWN